MLARAARGALLRSRGSVGASATRRMVLRAMSTGDHQGEQTGGTEHVVSVSRKGLLKSDYRHPSEGAKPPTSPLIDEIKLTIGVRGPVSISDWMKLCLGHPEFGYYMKSEVFGEKGDFVTSPEISSLFGELMGLWTLAVWRSMGRPPRVRIVELGPGKGTLMKDCLRISRKFKDFRSAIRGVHLVENSPKMRGFQRESLQCTMDKVTEADEDSTNQDASGRTAYYEPVRWHWQLADVPTDDPIIVIGNEFFDALPVLQFEHTERGWHEKLIDLDTSDSPDHFRYVLSPSPAASNFVPASLTPTPPKGHPNQHQLETSPVSHTTMETLALKLRKAGGAALIIDYGKDGAFGSSVQAVKDHEYMDVLANPGDADITAQVDFAAIRDVVENKLPKPKEGDKNLKVHRLVTQRLLLRELGLQQRLVDVLAKIEKEDDQVDAATAAWRLVDNENETSMGVLFKAMCITEEGLSVPPGFQEDLVDDEVPLSEQERERLVQPSNADRHENA